MINSSQSMVITYLYVNEMSWVVFRGYSLLNLCIYKNNPLKIRGVLGKTYNFAATTNKKETLYV